MNVSRTIFTVMAVSALCFGGCAPIKSAFQKTKPGQVALTVEDLDRIRWQLRGLTDTYMTRLAQTCNDIENNSQDPVIRQRARAILLGQCSAALSSAVGPQPLVNLLDFAAQVTLKRAAAEEYDMLTFGDAGKPLVEALRKSEAEVWAVVAQEVSQENIDELKRVIEAWRKAHPEQRYVAYVKFSEFADFSTTQKMGSSSPSSLFSLLYLDPLANLDPVAAEVRESRAFAERMAYLIQRLPILVQWQVNSSVAQVLESPPITSLLGSADKISVATDKFANTMGLYPDLLSKEREAALKQSAELVKVEREAAIAQLDEKLSLQRAGLFDGLQKQQDGIADKLKTTDQVMDKIRLGIGELSSTGKDTIAATEAATNRLITRAFQLALILILVVLIGVPIAVIVTRKLSRPAVRA